MTAKATERKPEEKPAEKAIEAPSLVTKVAERYGVDAGKLLVTLKATAFKQSDNKEISNEQMMALLVVADQYGLNPFTNEIKAFPDKRNGIVPVVGVDGWSRIINQHPQFDGVEFVYSDNWVQMQGCQVRCPEWIEAVIYRKDRSRPIRMKEFLDEVYRGPFELEGQFGPYIMNGPWQTHPKRLLRHKSLIQASRIGFGFVGIYDIDEAMNIVGKTYDNETGEPVSQTKPEDTRAPGPVLQLEEMESLLSGLIKRARQDGAWHSVHQYMEERFHDQPQTLTVAKQRITEAELAALADQREGTGEKDAVGDVEPAAEQTGQYPADGAKPAEPKGKAEKEPKAESKDQAKTEPKASRTRKTDKVAVKPDSKAATPSKPATTEVTEQDYPGVMVGGESGCFF